MCGLEDIRGEVWASLPILLSLVLTLNKKEPKTNSDTHTDHNMANTNTKSKTDCNSNVSTNTSTNAHIKTNSNYLPMLIPMQIVVYTATTINLRMYMLHLDLILSQCVGSHDRAYSPLTGLVWVISMMA